MHRPDYLSTLFVQSFEKKCPDLRMTAKEREQLRKLFSECQIDTWKSAQRVLADSGPKKD